MPQNPLRVLFISQEITPYLPETIMSQLCRKLPQSVQENGLEIRIFMPRFGCINERRNQLHEVQRLSGMNLIINDTDHPLIIKVASIQAARMQVYFIDNEDYFQRKAVFVDENGKEVTGKRFREICLELQSRGAHNINLVTPTHYVPQIAKELKKLKDKELKIPVVYNTSSYENVETIKRRYTTGIC